MSKLPSKKKSVVFAEKPIILNIDELRENGDTLDYDFQEQDSQARFLDSRSAFSDLLPKPILKKSSGINSPSLNINQEEPRRGLSTFKTKAGYSAISNIKHRIQKAIDDSKSGVSKIKGEVVNDLITIEELEKKPIEALFFQKYEGREDANYDGQTHLLEPVSALDMSVKSP